MQHNPLQGGNTIKKKLYWMLLLVGIIFAFNTVFAVTKKKIDLLIYNATIVTMDANKSVIKNGFIAIDDGKIIEIGNSSKQFKSQKIIDAKNNIVMPGLINTHTHIPMTLFRGISDDLPLKEWLEEHIWPLEKKYINAENVRLGSFLGMCEMIHSGTTMFNDMYFFEDEIGKAAKEIGMRVMLGETLFDFPTPNKKTPEEVLVYTEMLVKKWKDDSLVKVAVAPHAPYTCSKEVLLAARDFAKEYGLPLHIHISETQKELGSVEYLNSIGFFEAKVIAAHCVYLTEKEMDIIAEKKVGVSHNPSSNMKLASGVASIVKLLKKGVIVGLGTDGCASNNDLNMFEEMDVAAKLQKVINNDPTVVDAYSALKMATIDAAKILGVDDIVGSLEIEKRADIIMIDTNKAHVQPMYNVFSQLVYSIDGSDVYTVIIDGKIVMQDNKILTVDEGEILTAVQNLAISL